MAVDRVIPAQFRRKRRQMEAARREIDLRSKFAELRPDIVCALNRHLCQLWRDPSSAPIGSFDEASILNNDESSLHIVSVKSRSLFHSSHIAGNVCDQLIINPGKTKLRFRVLRQHFENEDFNRPLRLEFEREHDIAPGEELLCGGGLNDLDTCRGPERCRISRVAADSLDSI